MSMEGYFLKAIELYNKLETKTKYHKKEMKDVIYKYQLAKDYGELNTPAQEKLDRLFYDIKKEIR